MPDFSLRLPRFLRSSRSPSPSLQPSQPRPRDDTVIPHSPSLSSSPTSSHHPQQAVNAASATSHPSAPGHSSDLQGSAVYRFVGTAPANNVGGQPSWSPRSITPIGVDSAVQQPTQFASSSNPPDFVRGQADTPTTPSHQSSSTGPLSRLPSQDLRRPQHQNIGMFNHADNFSAMGNFIYGSVGSVTYNNTVSNQFMKELLKETIPGATSDSSARDPPPRCHPGTRLAILERCLNFVRNCNGEKKVCWVVGVAGVGKSAIMQNVAESPQLPVNYHASVFFSINGRNDGTKAIITISYQFAAKSEPYRQLIMREITDDPSLLQSSMTKQFDKFIVEPFIHDPQLKSAGRVLIIIDGIDECDHSHTQQDLLRLITDFCIAYPSSPLVWLIASRPESQITSFFSRRNVIPTYEKEEIPVESDEARADVERFLRDKLTEIKETSDSLDPQWPEEQDFWKLASAAGGLFAYAHTVIKYIGDPMIRSPVMQLSDILHVIDEHPMTGVSREEHPMALLDALYDRILSKVPPKIMINTRKLLLALTSGWDAALDFSGVGGNFIVLCNWLGMTPDEAYAAVNHLRSVLYVPRRDQAHQDLPKPFHKSFIDYISDFDRSRFFHNIQDEARQLKAQCAFRILKEAPDGISLGDMGYRFRYGYLLHGPGNGDKISLSWSVEEAGGWNNNETRLGMYKLAIGEVAAGLECGDPTFQSETCIRILTTRFQKYHLFPLLKLADVVFGQSRRLEFMTHGILAQIPLKAVDIFKSEKYCDVKLQFRRPAVTMTNACDPWNPSCQHEREGGWEEGKDQNWMTTFLATHCTFCFDRLALQLNSWKNRSAAHTAVVLFTSTRKYCVEVRFVDPRDGMSEWTYWFWCIIPLEDTETLYNVRRNSHHQ